MKPAPSGAPAAPSAAPCPAWPTPAPAPCPGPCPGAAVGAARLRARCLRTGAVGEAALVAAAYPDLLPRTSIAGSGIVDDPIQTWNEIIEGARLALVDRGVPWPGGRVVLSLTTPAGTYRADRRDLERAVVTALVNASREQHLHRGAGATLTPGREPS